MMIPGLELRFISDRIGRGVYTTRSIARGTIVWVLDPLDLRIREAEYRASTGATGSTSARMAAS